MQDKTAAEIKKNVGGEMFDLLTNATRKASLQANPRHIIRALRRRIPAFECEPGCHDCCGPVPFTGWEWKRLCKDMQDCILTDLNCPFLGPQGCKIYSERPILCRLFGAVDTPRLICPKGRRPEKLLSEKEGAEISAIWGRYVFGLPGAMRPPKWSK